MSILIKGISMPKKCTVCNFGDALMGKGFCYVSHCKQIEDYFVRNDRPTWCPLIELPPHGRLIDADELNALIDSGDDIDFSEVPETKYAIMQMVNEQDTILEASP